MTTPWLTERHGYDPTSGTAHLMAISGLHIAFAALLAKSEAKRS
ncbi:ComEC/Rec2 family competence protein [Pseudomonas aeruginosa]